MTKKTSDLSSVREFFSFLASLLFPGWASDAEQLAQAQEEHAKLDDIAKRIRMKYATAALKPAELAARAKALGVAFSNLAGPEFRAAILDHLENPHQSTDLDYMHLTWVHAADGNPDGKAFQLISQVQRNALHRLQRAADSRDGGHRVEQFSQFEADRADLKPGQTAVLGGPHDPVRSRTFPTTQGGPALRSLGSLGRGRGLDESTPR